MCLFSQHIVDWNPKIANHIADLTLTALIIQTALVFWDFMREYVGATFSQQDEYESILSVDSRGKPCCPGCRRSLDYDEVKVGKPPCELFAIEGVDEGQCPGAGGPSIEYARQIFYGQRIVTGLLVALALAAW